MRKICSSAFFKLIPLLTFLVFFESGLGADTFIVRPLPTSRLTAQASIGAAAIGERHCTEDRCIIIADTTAQVAVLRNLESKGRFTVQDFPEARKVFFGGATWDGETESFDRDFPGKAELPSNSPESLFAVVFKSFPEGEWLMALQSAGFVVTEPLPTMAYLVYGDRQALQRFAAKAPYIYRIVEVPSGLRRSNIDTYLPDDGDQPASTLIALINVSSSEVKKMLVAARGGEPPVEYVMNGIVAHSALLARADALYVSRFPEVVQVTRQTFKSGLSDERSNRIVAGGWQSPGSSWPGTLGQNTQLGSPLEWYWGDYLRHLSQAGLDLSRQTIGFLDTGVDAGISPCPPHLYDSAAGRCRLTFTTDVTTDFSTPDRAVDRAGHGTLTSSVAAGYVTDQTGGRDQNPGSAGWYSFTQGVAQGANVAMTKFFAHIPETCDADFRPAPGGRAETGWTTSLLTRTRYSLMMMNGTNPLPSQEFPGSPAGPGASVFNHSWNLSPPNPYDEISRLLDQTTRNPTFAWFDFGSTGSPSVYFGSGDPMLHVVASGNCIQWDFGQGRRVPCSGTVATPGLAKNVLTVGATESYNQQGYASGAFDACDSTNDLLRADNTGAIAPFSRISPDVPPQNYRYKPDLVAPGTRAYGRRSSRYQSSFVPPETIGSDFSCFLCNENLTGNAQYAWFRGTSFSTPAVSGAAAIVREWLRLTNSTLHFSDPFVWPSPALVKATLIAAARHLPESTAPLGAQGFGGLSLDTLFRAATNYYFFDQKFSLPNQGNGVWEKTLTVVPQRDVAIVLTWTDRFSVDGQGDLVNNLDLRVQAGSGLNMVYHGNNLTNGYSIQNPAYPVYDSVNTTEKVLIRADELANVGTITIHVSAFSLTGNALVTGDAITSPTGIHNGTQNEGTTLIPRQDFAIAVINAHE